MAALLLLGAALACGKRSETAAPAASAAPVVAPAPPGLLAEAVVREPGELYQALKTLGGPRAERLPARYELALSTLLGLPAPVAGRIAPGRPAVAAWVLPEGGEVAGVLGLQLSSGPELARELTRPTGGVSVVQDTASGLALLEAPEGPKLAVLDDWLLVAADPRALRLAGAYLARNLSRRSLPPEPVIVAVSEAALAGPLAAALRASWAARRASLAASAERARSHYGRRADFAEPAAVLGLADGAVQALLAALESCRSLRLALSPSGEGLELALELEPRPGGLAAQAARALTTGPLDPLLALPATAAVALLARAGDEELEAGGTENAAWLRALFGPRLTERDAEAVRLALVRWRRGRGATGVYALLGDRTLLAKEDVRDRTQMEPAVEEMLALLRLPALKQPLAPLLGEVSARGSALRLTSIDRPVERLQVARARGAETPAAEALWLVRDTSASLSLGPGARAGLLALDSASEAGTLRGSSLSAMAGRRGPASLALYANLGLFGREAGDAPLLVTYGKRGENPRVEAELSRGGALVLASALVPP